MSVALDGQVKHDGRGPCARYKAKCTPHPTAPATLTPLNRGEGAGGLEPPNASTHRAVP
jgi:hypothetical protein